MTVRIINRDPFARANLVREAVPLDEQCSCKFCGKLRKRHARALDLICAHLFRYGTQPDSIRGGINWHDGTFCSKSCHDAYHGS